MKKVLNSFIFIVLILGLLSSCTLVKLQDGEVIAPQNSEFKISPYWKFSKAYSLNKKEEIAKDSYYENQTLVLDKDIVLIGSDRINKPNIKAQRVKTYEYFISKYKVAPEVLGIKDEKLDIYSITDTKGYSIKILKLAEDTIAIEENNILVYFKKVDSLPEINLSLLKSDNGESNQNAVLIGLKGKRDLVEGKIGESKYRTIWIKYNKNKELQVYQMDNILLPRNNFYILNVEREENIDLIKERIKLTNISDASVKKEIVEDSVNSRFTDISFVSNEYISQVTRIAGNKSPGIFQFYTTKFIDKIDLEAKTTLKDLFGPEGSETYNEAAKTELTKEQKFESQKGFIDESSYILKRKNGAWIYEGRVNNKSDKNGEDFVNFVVNLRDNFKVFRFDALVPGWARIKVLNPNATDAVSSPNNFFSVIKTEDALLVYPKDVNGNIISSPIAKIELSRGEEIIMHEWAVDSYVDEWEKVVKKLGESIIN